MPEMTMSFSREQLEQIGEYVRTNLPGWLRTMPPQSVQITDPVLLERVVRVEEELKSQRELMVERFEAMDRRFEERFDAAEKRFEARAKEVDKRFEDNNRRFEDINKRFDDVNKRFEDMNKRFDDMNKRFTSTQWLIGILVTLFMGINTAIQLL